MSEKIDTLINNAKISELLHKKKVEEENKSCLLWVLAIVGSIAVIAAIAFAVYRYMNPKAKDFDDFDYDEFEDDFDDDFDDDGESVYVKPVK